MPIISIPNSIGGVTIPGAAVAGPLGVLFGNNKAINLFKYPRDLESATRGHVVKFDIFEIKPTGYEEGKKYTAATALNAVASSTKELVTTAVTDLLPNQVTDYLGLSKNNDGATKTELKLEPQKSKLKASIMLYMPDTASFSYEQNYSSESLLAAGEQALTNLPGFTGKAAKLITSAIDSAAGKIAIKSQGLAINPNQQLLFDGIDLRSFSMEFTFTPYSKAESDEVSKIIKLFKVHSRPRTVSGSGGMLFIPPSRFQLSFLFNGKQNPYIDTVAQCVITSLEINHAPNGWATHSDGSPVQTKLTIQFKEVELIDRNKIENPKLMNKESY